MTKQKEILTVFDMCRDLRLTSISGLDALGVLPTPTYNVLEFVNSKFLNLTADVFLLSTVDIHSTLLIRILPQLNTSDPPKCQTSELIEDMINGPPVLMNGQSRSTPSFRSLGVLNPKHPHTIFPLEY
jgi:hypothetical protein